MGGINLTELQDIVNKHLQRKGISKKFVGTIYSNVEDCDLVLSYFADIYRGKADYIAALEGSGFILGSMLSRELGIGFIPIAKRPEDEKWSEEYYRSVYVNHKNEPCALAVRKDLLSGGPRILIVDNWIETGATVECIRHIMEDAEAKVAGIVTLGINDNEKTRNLRKEIHITTIL